MGKLNIAHHKSYHPYRLDNIERVRKDEENAKLKEQGDEDRMRVADSEARLELLRGRAGEKNRALTRREDDGGDAATDALTTIATSSGHINLFADVEQRATSNAIARSREMVAKGAKTDDEKGVRLAPSAKDLKPWYVDEATLKEEMAEEKRLKDLSSKMLSDPLTSIKSQLSRSFPSSSPSSSGYRSSRPLPVPADATEARMQRETSERARAMALIRKKKREREREALGMGNMTPSSVGGYDLDKGGYGDVYNREETEEAHRSWDRNWGRRREREGTHGRRDHGASDRGHRYHDRRW